MPEPTWTRTVLVTLVVAVAGAGAAIGLSHSSKSDMSAPTSSTTAASTRAATTTVPAQATTTTTRAATTTTATTTTVATTTTEASPAGAGSWPAGATGWTLVLGSYPEAGGVSASAALARRAVAAGLPHVGVLRSSAYTSLRAGYLVVFSGVYPSSTAAEAGHAEATAAGFIGAYVRQIAR